MLEMEYTGRVISTNPRVLDHGTYQGYEYYILSLDTHPCAYIVLPEGHYLHGKDIFELEDVNIKCHDYFSHASNQLANGDLISAEENKWVIGWDYAHIGDWFGVLDEKTNTRAGNKKWTTQEIKEELEETINDLKNTKFNLDDWM